MRVRRPPGFGELHEDLGVGSHGEFLDGSLLPLGQSRRELDGILVQDTSLQDTQRESANGIRSSHTAPILIVDSNAVL